MIAKERLPHIVTVTAFVVFVVLGLACASLEYGQSAASSNNTNSEAEAAYNRAGTYYNRRDYDMAIAEYTAALWIQPGYVDALYRRGAAYLQKGDYDRAIADFWEALRLNPNHAGAKDFLARAEAEKTRQSQGGTNIPQVSGPDELDIAIRDASDYLNENIPEGSMLVILNVQSDSAAFAQNESDFTINDEGTITAYKGWDTNIAIPAQIGGRQVRGIAENVFRSMDLTGVTFPDGIRYVGQEAFSNNKLARITIPDGVYVGTQAFANNQLTNVTLGDRVFTGASAFAGNRITSVTLGERVAVGTRAFSGNQITSLTMGGMVRIGSEAFANNKLARLAVPDGTVLSSQAFANNQLTSLSMGDGVWVDSEAFASNQLTGFSMGGGGAVADRAFSGNRLNSITLGAGISFNAPAFGSSAYYDYQLNERKAGTYTTAEYPSRNEGDYAFIETRYGAVITRYNGSGGNRLIIPAVLNGKAVKGIGNSAFQNKNISRMQLPEGLLFIGAGAFSQNQLTEAAVPESVSFIISGAFSGNQLTSVPVRVPGSNNANNTLLTRFTEMVRIEPGTFTMGSPANEPGRDDNETQHRVALTQGFYMGAYAVTQAQYQAVMGTNPSYRKGNFLPVERVNWYDALVFCNRLSVMEGLTPAYSINNSTDPARWGSVPTSSNSTWNAVTVVSGSTGYRLPTEAQWEYACRAGTTTAYNTGDSIRDDTGWYDNNSGGRTREVGLKPANAWGLYDMHGNVWEWCWDWYGSYEGVAQTDPTGAVSGFGRVVRGGSWDGNGQVLRSASRNYSFPGYPVDRYGAYGVIGFRLVRP